MIGSYERLLAPLTAQTVGPLLDAAALQAGDRVLDVCAGHGVLAGAARQRGAEVSGFDFAPEVLATARRNVPGVDFIEGDAQELPYGAGTFDKVLCGYGIIHMPEPERAVAEMFRILIPGGRAALSVWAGPAPDNGFGLLLGAVKQHGRFDVPLPHGPDFFQFSDPAHFAEILGGFGFVDVEVGTIEQFWDLPMSSSLLDGNLEGGVRSRALLKAQDASAFAAIRKAVEAGMEEFRSGAQLQGPDAGAGRCG